MYKGLLLIYWKSTQQRWFVHTHKVCNGVLQCLANFSFDLRYTKWILYLKLEHLQADLIFSICPKAPALIYTPVKAPLDNLTKMYTKFSNFQSRVFLCNVVVNMNKIKFDQWKIQTSHITFHIKILRKHSLQVKKATFPQIKYALIICKSPVTKYITCRHTITSDSLSHLYFQHMASLLE
jgi:hypothetical protein